MTLCINNSDDKILRVIYLIGYLVEHFEEGLYLNRQTNSLDTY